MHSHASLKHKPAVERGLPLRRLVWMSGDERGHPRGVNWHNAAIVLELAVEFVQLQAYALPLLPILRASHLWLGGGWLWLTWPLAMALGVCGWVYCAEPLRLATTLALSSLLGIFSWVQKILPISVKTLGEIDAESLQSTRKTLTGVDSLPNIERRRWVKVKWAELEQPTWEAESSLPLPVAELPGGTEVPQVIWSQTAGRSLVEFNGKPVAQLFAEERPSVECVLAWTWQEAPPPAEPEEPPSRRSARKAKKKQPAAAALFEHGQALEVVGEAEDQALRKGEPQVWRNLGRRGVVEGYVTQQDRHYFQLRLDAGPDNEADEPSDAVISVAAEHLRPVESGERRKLCACAHRRLTSAKDWVRRVPGRLRAHRDEWALLLGGACLVPIALQLFTPLHCAYFETAPRVWAVHLHADDAVPCFEALHLFWMFFSLLGIALYVPSVCLYMPLLYSRPSPTTPPDPALTIAYKPHFIAARTLLRTALPGLQTFLAGRSSGNLVLLVLSTAGTLCLFLFVAALHPCSSRTVNYIHLSSYACALWSAAVVLGLGLVPEDDVLAPPPSTGLQPEPEPEPEPEPFLLGGAEGTDDAVVAAAAVLLGWLAVALLWCVPRDCTDACRAWKASVARLTASSKVNIYAEPHHEAAAKAKETHPSMGGDLTHLDGLKYHAGARVQLVGNANDKKFAMGPERETWLRLGDEGKVLHYDGRLGRFVVMMEPTTAHPTPDRLAVLPAHLAEAFPWSHVPLDELAGEECPDAVDETKKERYLSPDDLRLAFRAEGVVDLAGFYRLPRWKQTRAKRRAGLAPPTV